MPSEAAGSPAGGTPASRVQSTGDAQAKRDGKATIQALKDIGDWLRICETPERLIHAWERVRRACEEQEKSQREGRTGGAGATAQEIADIIDKKLEYGLQRIESKVEDKLQIIQKAVREPAKVSYAEMAKGLHRAGTTIANPPTTVRAPSRYQREVVVAAGQETEEQKQRNGKELVEELNKYCAGKVLAARRLGSGDVLVTTKDRASRQDLQKEKEWLEGVFGEGTSLRRKAYTVLVHGIRVNTIDTMNSPEAIQAIYTENHDWAGNIEVLAVAWSRKTLRDKKPVAPLFVSVAEPEQANRLIDTGMCWGSQLHDCEPFVGDCQVTQCFKCFKYGHTGRHCKERARCGYCNGIGYGTNTCPKKDNPVQHRCAAYAIPEARHRAWAPECPIRKNKVTAARRAYAQRPTRFEVPRGPAGPAPADTTTIPMAGIEKAKAKPILQPKKVIARRGNTSGMQVDSQHAPQGAKRDSELVDSDSDSDGFIEVKRRRAASAGAALVRLGRPREIARPEKGNQSIKNLLTPDPASQS